MQHDHARFVKGRDTGRAQHLNLQRHSDHHANARRRYQVLQHHDDSPQLPAGYATMFVLALVPPLWRRIMDPRAVHARRATPHLEGA